MLGAVAVVCAAALLAVVWVPSRAALSARAPRHFADVPTQVSFDPVAKVPRCADYSGTGGVPAEGHAVLFVQPPEDSTMYYGAELSFDSAGWIADDVVLGEVDDRRHFTLYIHAVSAEPAARLRSLPPRHPIAKMPTRMLDSLIAIRGDRPDTC